MLPRPLVRLLRPRQFMLPRPLVRLLRPRQLMLPQLSGMTTTPPLVCATPPASVTVTPPSAYMTPSANVGMVPTMTTPATLTSARVNSYMTTPSGFGNSGATPFPRRNVARCALTQGTPVAPQPATPAMMVPAIYTPPSGRSFPRTEGPRPLFPPVGRYQGGGGGGPSCHRLPGLRSYDGKEKWETYWQHLISVVALNQWTDEEATRFLLLALRDKAAEVTFLPPEGGRWSFKELCLTLGRSVRHRHGR